MHYQLISAAIEEDYAKRLSKLSKFALGKDEVGYVHNFFRNSSEAVSSACVKPPVAQVEAISGWYGQSYAMSALSCSTAPAQHNSISSLPYLSILFTILTS